MVQTQETARFALPLMYIGFQHWPLSRHVLVLEKAIFARFWVGTPGNRLRCNEYQQTIRCGAPISTPRRNL